ncbi:MAG: DMT family transporter [Bacteroidetes bacterium]|nr:DMT family transporter [Bacteroidota bacterium]MDA1292090.1 DMT family transporter [Pseudomonadota bacterium]
MTSTTQRSFRSEIELLSVVLFWGLNFVIVKIVLQVMHPHAMNLFRLLAASGVLTWIYWRRSGYSYQAFISPMKTDGWAIVRLSIIGWILYQAAFISGLNLTSAGNGAILMSSAPIWTALLSLAMRTEKLSLQAWAGLMLSIVGTTVIVVFSSTEIDLSSDMFIGNAIILGASVLWGFYTALTRPLVQKHSPLSLTVLALLISLVPLSLLSMPYLSETNWAALTIWYWLAIFFSGALSTGVAIVFWNNAVRNLGASHTAAFGNLVPLIALFSGFLILGDPILPAQILGGTLIIGGLVIMRWARKKKLVVQPSS